MLSLLRPRCLRLPTGSVPARLGIGMLALLPILVAPAPAAAEVTIVAPEEVLQSWTIRSGNHLFFQDPDGRLWELVTEVSDPIISNKGTGVFHTQDLDVVRAAVESIDFPLDECEVKIFVLPYPRRSVLRSSAQDGAICLSPGVVPYVPSQIHALVAHELGHVIHRAFLPDADGAGWARYRQLRGIEDRSVYSEEADHRNRPHEIFAEDFRFLFGGAQANYSSSIENRDLALPDQVPGLEAFFLTLNGAVADARQVLPPRRLQLFPNPSPGAVNIAFGPEAAAPGSGDLVLRIHDVQGRLIAQETLSDAPALRWEGRTLDGRDAAPGMYFVRVRRGDEEWAGKVLITR